MNEKMNAAETAATNERVTIVSGLPRSGTSMMMQILEAGGVPVLTDNARHPDEDNPRGYYEFEAVKRVQRDASWLHDARGQVVKMVYRLLYDLPADHEYRVIFVKRPLEETVASQDEMLRRNGNSSADMSEAQLVAIYRRQLRDIETWLQAQPNFSTLYVDYHDVLADTASVVDEINDFLGGCLDTDAMRAVPDRSLYRQRRDPRSFSAAS
ncbi:MAG: sulfotransferase domain-containing protein [Chloroflexota bacterium]